MRLAVRFLAVALLLGGLGRAATSRNMFANPGFEMGGTAPWHLDKGGRTIARFELVKGQAAEGDRCARITIERIDSWGTQFGQTIEAGKKGKTYTFAALVKAVGKPVKLDLQIERHARPWDRAAKSQTFTITPDRWQEIHVTFKLTKDFPQGWFAYISCTQPGARYLADAFRLYEGDYVPYEKIAKERAAAVAVRLFDTGKPSPKPLDPAALTRRTGWTQVPEGQLPRRFSGDAVVMNNRLALVLRRGSRSAELYSLRGEPRLRASLSPVGDAPAARLVGVRAVRNEMSGVALDATFETKDGRRLAIWCRLTMGQPFVHTVGAAGVKALRVAAPCRFVVLPDFFADDIVADATSLPVAEADLPSENFLLHFVGEGDAIVMTVSKSRGNDIRITLAGTGDQRRIQTSTIQYGDDRAIWVAILDGPGTWHVRNIQPSDKGKIIRLGWRMPYQAAWRVDWRQDNGLTDSWEMAIEKRGGGYLRPGWFGPPRSLPPNRKRWTTVLGRFLYPCWVDKRGQGYLQPLARVVRFEGPALLYPINRTASTPLEEFTVVDIVRATLGVGPCEYILDVESHKEAYKGRATCATRDLLRGIYKAGQQKRRRAQVEQALVDVLTFIRHIRSRIETYVAFAHEILGYLAEQKRAHPELADGIAQLEALAKEIDQRVERRRAKIKTPEVAARLVEEFKRTVLDYEGPDAYERCKRITAAWVEIGGNQDELVGECRMVVKRLRQRAGLLMALDPRMRPIATEVRRRTQKVLRNPASYEAPRH